VIDLHAFTGSPGAPSDLDGLSRALLPEGIRLVPCTGVPSRCEFVLGYSFGCVAALETLRRHPGARALLVSPYLRLRTLSVATRILLGLPMTGFVMAPWRERLLRAHLRKASGGEGIPPELERQVMAYPARELVASRLARHRTAREIGQAERDWAAAAPRARILAGGADPAMACPAMGWDGLREIPGAGHFLPWTRRDEVVREIVGICQTRGEEEP